MSVCTGSFKNTARREQPMSRVVLDGVVVRYASRPAEALYERSPLLFAGFVFLVTVVWIGIAKILQLPLGLVELTTPLVIVTATFTPVWFTQRAYLDGAQTLILDERGLQVNSVLIPWSDLRFTRHGDLESAVSLWRVGPETVIASFEHEGMKFSAFLGVRFRDRRPLAFTERLEAVLDEKKLLRLESMITEHSTDLGPIESRPPSIAETWSGTRAPGA